MPKPSGELMTNAEGAEGMKNIFDANALHFSRSMMPYWPRESLG